MVSAIGAQNQGLSTYYTSMIVNNTKENSDEFSSLIQAESDVQEVAQDKSINTSNTSSGKKVFSKLDLNKDGTITIDEILTAGEQINGTNGNNSSGFNKEGSNNGEDAQKAMWQYSNSESEALKNSLQNQHSNVLSAYQSQELSQNMLNSIMDFAFAS